MRGASQDVAQDLFLDPTERLNRKVDLLYKALTDAGTQPKMLTGFGTGGGAVNVGGGNAVLTIPAGAKKE